MRKPKINQAVKQNFCAIIIERKIRYRERQRVGFNLVRIEITMFAFANDTDSQKFYYLTTLI